MIGGGYISCEQASIYNNFGAEVHLLVRSVRPPGPGSSMQSFGQPSCKQATLSALGSRVLGCRVSAVPPASRPALKNGAGAEVQLLVPSVRPPGSGWSMQDFGQTSCKQACKPGRLEH